MSATTGNIIDSKLDKVRALLAKAERTDNEHEAAVYMDKANELMLRYSIDEAMIANSQGFARTEPILVSINVGRTTWEKYLAAAAAEGAGCSYVLVKPPRSNGQWKWNVAGLPADVEWAQVLLTSLMLQVSSAVLRDGVGYSRAWRGGYRLGYASRVRTRILEARQAATKAVREERGSGADLVLVDSAQAAKALIGRTSSSKIQARPDARGYTAGSAAGNAASFSRNGGLRGSRHAIAN